MKNLFTRSTSLNKHKYILGVSSFFVITSLCLMGFIYTGPEASLKTVSNKHSLIDMIPKGFVMIPITLDNHEPIQDLISSHAIVDLYQKEDASSSIKVATAVRMVRSSSHLFSILIPENQVAVFLNFQKPLHAVIQHAQKSDSRIESPKMRRARSIHILEKLIVSDTESI